MEPRLCTGDVSGGSATMKSEGWVYHTAQVNAVAFSPDGAWLTSVSNDSSIYLFSVDGAKRTQYPNLHEEGIKTIAWLSDTSVVTGGNDGQIRTFEVCA